MFAHLMLVLCVATAPPDTAKLRLAIPVVIERAISVSGDVLGISGATATHVFVDAGSFQRYLGGTPGKWDALLRDRLRTSDGFRNIIVCPAASKCSPAGTDYWIVRMESVELERDTAVAGIRVEWHRGKDVRAARTSSEGWVDFDVVLHLVDGTWQVHDIRPVAMT